MKGMMPYLGIATIVSAALLTGIGCDGNTNDPAADLPPPDGGAGLGASGQSSPIKAIMVKLDRGPTARPRPS